MQQGDVVETLRQGQYGNHLLMKHVILVLVQESCVHWHQ